MTKKVVLMANDFPGVEVAKYLVSQKDKIIRLYIHEKKNQKLVPEIIKASKCKPSQIFKASQVKRPAHVKGLKKLGADFIITVYWSHLLKQEVIDCAKQTINFHPALLPVNRGWYPHVHSILDGSAAGITLHAIDKGADTGPVWAQKKIAISDYDTAFTIYHRLQKEMVKLFKKTWPKVKAGKIKPRAQDNKKAIYHKKSEIDQLDKLNPQAKMKVEEVIRILRARSFGDKGFAYYQKKGKKIYLNLRLSKNISFD